MQIFTDLNKNPNLSLALGFFDGIHLGHQAVIKSAVDFANKSGKKSAVITFKDHPCCYFLGVCPKYILSREEKERKLKELGVDFLYELDFGNISNLNAEDYLKNILVKYFSPISISTGWNHNFGYKKSGNVEFLHTNSSKYSYKYFELQPQKINNEIISSTAIRNLLSQGNIEKANLMLGYQFSITGEVVKGNQIGRTIGFNTANLIYPNQLIELPHGVYSVDTNFGKAIANFGVRPTIGNSCAVIEVHILNFDKDIYGKTLTVKFNKMLRPEKKFNSLDALKAQIKKDINNI